MKPCLGWKFLLRRAWLDENGSPSNFHNFHPLSEENQVSLLRIFLSGPDPDGKSTDLGVRGGKKGPDYARFNSGTNSSSQRRGADSHVTFSVGKNLSGVIRANIGNLSDSSESA